MTRRVKFIASLTVAVALVFGSVMASFMPAEAAGATLLLSPSKGTYNVGGTFSVSVLVNSGTTGINAAEASMSFSSDLINVTAISQSNSILELWTAKPTFSNKSGSISFGGGLTTAYKGTAGRLFTVSFKTIKAGTAKLSFSGGTVTAADGLGTNVYSGGSTGTYTIAEKAKVEEPKPTETTPKPKDTAVKPADSLLGSPISTVATTAKASSGMLPPAPEVTSPTHASADQWYSANTAKFEWKTLSSITGVSMIVTDSTSSDPGPKSDGTSQSKEYKNVANGIHYFHVKLQNKDGWGPISHRKFMVDAEIPTTPQLTISNGGDSTNPSPLLKIVATDRVSGISKYKLSLNSANIDLEPRDYSANPYQLEKLLPGTYVANVIASDMAGNTSSSSLTFSIEALRAPTITDAPKELMEGDDLTVRGSSFYPNSTVKLYIKAGNGDPQIHDIKTDDKGDWNYFHTDNRLTKNGYQLWAKVVDARGAESVESNKHFLNVSKPDIVTAYGIYIIIALIFIIILLVLYILQLKKKFIEQQGEIEEEAMEAQKRIGEVFAALHEEVDELMVFADKRPGLSESERRVKEKLKEALNISEEFLAKEVEDIEKEIEATRGKRKKKA